MNTYPIDMCLFTLEIGAAQVRAVTGIALTVLARPRRENA